MKLIFTRKKERWPGGCFVRADLWISLCRKIFFQDRLLFEPFSLHIFCKKIEVFYRLTPSADSLK